MKTIPIHPLRKRRLAIVDDSDYSRLMNYKWFISVSGYVVCNLGIGVTGHMHKMVMESSAMHDHRNRNKLDNRRSNLRPCNHSQNGANQLPRKSNKTGLKGVVWDRFRSKYRAQIKINQKVKNLGRFNTPEEAAAAYDAAAITAWGSFALTNKERIQSV